MFLRLIPLFLVVWCLGAGIGPAAAGAPLQLQDTLTAAVTDDGLVLENSVVRRVIAFTRRAGAIRPVSIFHKHAGREALAEAGASAWFEFPVNGSPVTSLDPVWEYREWESRDLKHGGKETDVVFEAVSGPARGLRVRYTVQAYPGATVFRERIRLEAAPASSLTLTHVNDSAQVVFPRYTATAPSGGTYESREIRIAGWARDLLDAPAAQPSFDERSLEAGYRTGANLSQNYMYHPRLLDFSAEPGRSSRHKGPVLMHRLAGEPFGWWMAYEHGSPDEDPRQTYVVLDRSATAGAVTSGVRIIQGAFFDGEPITSEQPFTTNWAEVALFAGDFEDGMDVLWDYLYRWITDEPASREPVVYYNTWGMQRDEQTRYRDVHGTGFVHEVLRIDTVLAEVDRVQDLGVEMFVLDDGWQDYFGDWNPHPTRFPNGLQPLKAELDRRGMLFGIWLAPIHGDPSSPLLRSHPEWLLQHEKPVSTRWNKPMFCLESDFYHHFIAVSKRLIDAGARHFKWDGVDTNYWCQSPDHWHGGPEQTPEERRLRYGYEFVRTITRAIEELKAYEPSVVIEFDATEPDRSIGLSILSEAKYYWMNNGASWYSDRSRHRIMSMRMVPALFHGIIPPVLQSAANYPHNQTPYLAQRYAVNTSLLGGLGYWGDLGDMTEADRQRAGEHIRTARRVLEHTARIRPSVIGTVGSTPEIYTYVDTAAAAGQVIGFTGAATQYDHTVPGVDTHNLLAVLRNAYRLEGDRLIIPFHFHSPMSSLEAFVIPNDGAGVTVTASTSWLKDARLEPGGMLVFVTGAAGVHDVRWPRDRGEPRVQGGVAGSQMLDGGDPGYYTVRITTDRANATVVVSPGG